MNKKRPKFEEFKKRLLQEPEAQAAYDALEPEFALLRQFIKARQKANVSQMELAGKLDLQQPAIARLERGGYMTTSVSKLAKVANALGYSLKVSLSPKKSTPSQKKPSRTKRTLGAPKIKTKGFKFNRDKANTR